jgi:UDP-N-acetylmuramate--alanine ligase
MKLSDIAKAHFIGIGGIGMSGLARLFLGEGKEVSGSDRSPSHITDALQAEGVTFFTSQVASNISDDIDLVVYTEAMAKDHEELVAAREKGIKTVNYFEALGMVANEYYLIAVAGSHGKTTTTAMLIDIFEEVGLDPSAIVGSLRAKTKSNYRKGKSKYFIVEACEYKRDFMSLEPDILVITNIEHEHVDYYPDLASVQAAFRELALKVPEDGFVIANTKDENVAPMLEELSATVINYTDSFDPLRKITMPGVHNQMNAAAAIAAALQSGIGVELSEKALTSFGGTWRRFEYKGEVRGAKVYDDYGHHPTEITATVRGARELYPDKNIILVFQSHTYSRTKALFDNFANALVPADEVIILPIYAARETNESGVSHTRLALRVNQKGGHATPYETFEATADSLKNRLTVNDVVIVMGAGDVTEVAKLLTEG